MSRFIDRVRQSKTAEPEVNDNEYYDSYGNLWSISQNGNYMFHGEDFYVVVVRNKLNGTFSFVVNDVSTEESEWTATEHTSPEEVVEFVGSLLEEH